VKYCQEKGLKVIHSDLLSHLRSLKDGSLGFIFCAHVIEHLHSSDAIEFLRQTGRVLKPKSRLVLIAPNAKDIRTAERFWLDITHVRLYPKKLLCFIFQREGYRVVRAFADKEPANNILIGLVKRLVRWWFLGYMFVGDLVIIAER